ncbi:hypothetical protein ACLOJK_019112 [Asimina triloba]
MGPSTVLGPGDTSVRPWVSQAIRSPDGGRQESLWVIRSPDGRGQDPEGALEATRRRTGMLRLGQGCCALSGSIRHGHQES